MKPFIPGRPHWWQWPTILSLDAPAVALAWQALLARVARVDLGRPEAFVLGTSIWLAYTADRWIEGWRLAPAQIRTQRHHFYQRWRWPIAVAWFAVFGTDCGVAWAGLSTREFGGGLVLLAPVLLYLLSHQLVHRHHAWRVPKEICVALLLTGGVGLFLVTAPLPAPRPVFAGLALFGALCLANCALISLWERGVDEAHGQTSLALQFDWAHWLARALPWIIALVSALLAWRVADPLRTAAACSLASGGLLGLLDLTESRLGPRLARVLADAALLTPLLPLARGGFPWS